MPHSVDVYYARVVPLFGNLTPLLNTKLVLLRAYRIPILVVSCGAECYSILTANYVLLIMMVSDNF